MIGKGTNMLAKRTILCIAIVTLGLILCSMALAQGPRPGIERARQVHDRYRDHISALPEVVGSAVGQDEQDEPVIHILLERPNGRGLPRTIDGIRVGTIVTGKIYALAFGRPAAIKPQTNPYYYARPVPIGVSTGNANERSAGTIACRVTDGQFVYALSNNHVYALENTAEIGDIILQPGLYDITDYTGNKAKYFLGLLEDFYPIEFSEEANNLIDAAIAITDADHLGKGTPSGGYGVPRSQTLAAQVRMPVMKYGRTTRLTTGRVYAIDATVKVQYGSGVARFVHQILITPGTFSKAGDSGSLVVCASGENYAKPVGLLFAGSSSVVVANPIDAVLDYFDVQIDGQ